MDFSQIEDMKDVIYEASGRRNENLARFEYRVSVYNYDQNSSLNKKPVQELRFGNLDQDRFSVDYVDITIYRDKVRLHPVFEGAKWYEAALDHRKELPLEKKIMMALNAWSSSYNN
jgi:hypothetical protein